MFLDQMNVALLLTSIETRAARLQLIAKKSINSKLHFKEAEEGNLTQTSESAETSSY